MLAGATDNEGIDEDEEDDEEEEDDDADEARGTVLGATKLHGLVLLPRSV